MNSLPCIAIALYLFNPIIRGITHGKHSSKGIFGIFSRIPDSYHAKTLKMHTPLVRFALYFHYWAVFQKFERSFFDPVAVDVKSVLSF